MLLEHCQRIPQKDKRKETTVSVQLILKRQTRLLNTILLESIQIIGGTVTVISLNLQNISFCMVPKKLPENLKMIFQN